MYTLGHVGLALCAALSGLAVATAQTCLGNCDFYLAGVGGIAVLGQGDYTYGRQIVGKSGRNIRVANTNGNCSMYDEGDCNNLFYFNGNHLSSRTSDKISATGVQVQCVHLDITSVEFSDGSNLNPGDGNVDYPTNRRCLKFFVGPTSSQVAQPPPGMPGLAPASSPVINTTEAPLPSPLGWVQYLNESLPPSPEGLGCPKDSIARVATGGIPLSCPGDHPDKFLGLCYKKCDDGFDGTFTICQRNSCPSGWPDIGISCTKPVATINPGGLFSSNCPPDTRLILGFCSPKCPDGYRDDGAFCKKPSYDRGIGIPPTGCGDGFENIAGLCYENCPNKYYSTGTVCWQNCPSSRPHGCDPFCTVNEQQCTELRGKLIAAGVLLSLVVATGWGGAALFGVGNIAGGYFVLLYFTTGFAGLGGALIEQIFKTDVASKCEAPI